ncbi:hypothetical protein C8F04DRAFT_7939 [Mycena alexandri]|uniref:Nuclear GTPase SLIP-GC n=1 Tax=Mycena alexandri TaxID=1745969 RepID=A0AAD6TP65_9AGAR|nr:hypothetical protein C8F04DRAFT_7939 [Mycena alexandri]
MSHYKENMGNNPSQSVKLEPTEVRMPALAVSNGVKIKSETIDPLLATVSKPEATASTVPENKQEVDAPMEDVAPPPASTPPPTSTPLNASDYTIYTTAEEIPYTPEHALQQGLKMINKLASSIGDLQLGPRRQEVWLRDTESLRGQGVPSTLIAICGATGAGKSSILNAILDDNIVPTSGMRACTAVVTEIAYHKKKTIDADVSFLSESEWKDELEILLGDLSEEDGTVKRSTDLKSDAGVAWSKVHAVYPTISRDKLVTMTADQIIAKDPKIAKILGATKKIVAKDSKTFGAEIAKYIDSKNQKRGKGKDKKDKDKKKEKTKDKNKDDTPALWPLIRRVNVRCPAAALATGAILVDLPGSGDANAARNSIAKTYMKKANCVWVLAPIQRAVDEKTAKGLLGDAFRTQLMMDGGYDANTITFIATKCDDISCSEVITALDLHEEPELEEIDEKMGHIADNTAEWKKKKQTADRLVKSVEKELKQRRAIHSEHKEHLEAVQDGKPFVARLTAKKNDTVKPKAKAPKGKKRKNARGGKKGSPKRRKSESLDSGDDEDDKMSSSDEKDSDDSDSDSDSDSNDSEDELFDDDSDKESDDGEESDREKDSDIESVQEEEEEEEEEEETEEMIKDSITESKKLMDETRQRLNDARKAKKEAIDHLATLKKKKANAQKEKNAFCSKKRSEYSIDVLKEDFRSGLKELDEAAAEARDPDNFDPSIAIRDYNAIDLPVFTCSSRDYVRLQRQVKGDGEPSCFSDPRDTGIPELQEWCHTLTRSSRERAAKSFFKQLGAFARDVKHYVSGIGGVSAADRDALREKFESGEIEAEPAIDDDPFAAILGGSGLYTIPTTVPKVDRYGQLIGITPRLVAEFGKVVETNVSLLKEHLRDGLEERCRVGAANAAESAVPTSDEFAGSMHWGSYRATLRRNGEYRRDLNVELVNPFTRNIAQKWQQVFEADIFSPLLSSTLDCINKLVRDVERSAVAGLKDRSRIQGESCLESARVALDETVETVKQTLQNEQKEVSRSLAPHVQGQLLDGYLSAMDERGPGSVARQKAVFHDFIKDSKDEIFEDSADVILERLDDAADAIGRTLTVALDNLAQKVEVNLAVLWEGVRDDPGQVKARSDTIAQANKVLDQLRLFAAAEAARHDVNEDTVMT